MCPRKIWPSFGKVWSEYDHSIEQAVTWADVKSNIAAKEVAALATAGSWKIYEAALVLLECDSKAQLSSAPSSTMAVAANNLARR